MCTIFQSRGVGWGLFVVLMLGLLVPVSVGQQDEMESIERTLQLLKQLKGSEVSERDKAQAELLRMGPLVLDHIEIDEDATKDLRNRLAVIRRQLEDEAVAAVSEASQVTLVGEMTIDEALAAIKFQTGNQVELDSGAGDKKITLELREQTFWKSLRRIMNEGNLAIDKYGAAPGMLKLAIVEDPNPAPGKVFPQPVNEARIFDVEVARVASSMNLQWPNQNYTTVTLVVRWEPRLRPISINLPLSKVSIRDEFDAPAKVADLNSVIYGTIQPEIPELEFPLTIVRIDRQIESLKSIKATIDAVLPGRIEAFRFRNIKDQRVGRTIQRAGATVTYGGIQKNEDVYMVTLSLSFEKENNALESHQGWVFDNEIFLQDTNGKREESIGFETIQQDNAKVTVRYLFLEDPGDRMLVYKTPAAIVKMPINIELKKIPLP